MLCTCPPASEPGDISFATCFEDFGEIQRFWGQRVYSSGTTRNGFVISTNDPADLAEWSTLFAASDSTKVVQFPYTENIQLTASEARTVGGGGESLGGTTIVKGSTPTGLGGMFYEIPQYIAYQIKQWQCEVMGVYLINEYGQIGGLGDKVDGTAIANFYPIPVARRTFFTGDKQFGLYEGRDGNAFSFMFLPNWSDYFAIVTPSDFDPRLNLS